MDTYPKIETLFNRDIKTFGVIEGDWRLPEFEYLKNCRWWASEKLHGFNTRIHWDTNQVRYMGRTENSQIPTFAMAYYQDMFTVELFKEHYPDTPMTLHGETVGAKIQHGGGNYKADGVFFACFDIAIPKDDGENVWWLKWLDITDICDTMKIPVVPPLVGHKTLTEWATYTRLGFSSAYGNFGAEGLVLKPSVQLFNRQGKRIIAKIKYGDFAR